MRFAARGLLAGGKASLQARAMPKEQPLTSSGFSGSCLLRLLAVWSRALHAAEAVSLQVCEGAEARRAALQECLVE